MKRFQEAVTRWSVASKDQKARLSSKRTKAYKEGRRDIDEDQVDEEDADSDISTRSIGVCASAYLQQMICRCVDTRDAGKEGDDS